MALQGIITQDIPSLTQQIVFSNPSTLDSITYLSGTGVSYPIASGFTLSQSDFNLWFQYKTQFYNALFNNFPVIGQFSSVEVPVVQMKIYSSNGPNIIQYYQTSTASPVNLVYNITFDRGALTATFGERSSAITITPQEYLMGFQFISAFANQVQLV